MVSAFQYGKAENTTGRLKYSTPGAMEQAGIENLSVPWATTVLPAIWNNVETMGYASLLGGFLIFPSGILNLALFFFGVF